MVSTAFQIFVLAVLASTFIDEFNLSRFQLGLIGSLNTAVGALTAPFSGRLTDRIGPRYSTIAAQTLVAAGFALMALSQSTATFVLASALLGLPQGWGNPSTNALIAERVPPGARGTTTGIKQSGVQLGIFIAGASLPAMSDAFGWRGAMWIYAGIYAAFALLPLLLPVKVTAFAATAAAAAHDQNAKPYDMAAVWFIAAYAFLMGTVGGGISRFLALFVEEEVGLSAATAGWVMALSGLAGIASRIIAGRLAEQRYQPLPLLGTLSIIGAAVCVLLMLVLSVGAWLLWPIAILFAVGHGAWNAVAMLAIITGVPKADAGRASGAVMFGFLGGLAVGGPVAGLVIDRADSYQPVWIGAIVISLAAAVVARYAHTSATS